MEVIDKKFKQEGYYEKLNPALTACEAVYNLNVDRSP